MIGAGGVGGYFGGHLAARGYDVSFLARGAHLAALRRDGLTVKGMAEAREYFRNAVAGEVDRRPA